MTIKTSVATFCKAIEKERLIERSIYLLDQVIHTTERTLKKIRTTYNAYDRKKITRHGKIEYHYLYEPYIQTNKACINIKEHLLKNYQLLKQLKVDVLRTDEFGKLHAERYAEFVFIAKLMKIQIEKTRDLFGGWFLFYTIRITRIYNRFKHHMKALLQLYVNEGEEVYSAFRQDLSAKNAPENENTNLKEILKTKMKTLRYFMESSPEAVPVAVASHTTHYHPMAIYYKNSPLHGDVVPIPKNKEFLQKILEDFVEFTSDFDSLGKRLKTAKNLYSNTHDSSRKTFWKRNNTFTGNPGSIRQRTIHALLLRMGEFKKLVRVKQSEIKGLQVDEQTFVQVLEVIEKGKPKCGYLELKRIIEHLFNETKDGNVNYETLMEMKALMIEKSEELDRSLKKHLDSHYVDKHFPKITFDISTLKPTLTSTLTSTLTPTPNKTTKNKQNGSRSTSTARSTSRSRTRPEYEFHV